MRKLRKKYKSAGIGCYWMIVEMIYEEGGSLPYDAADLAFELQEPEEMIADLLNEFGLFENDGKVFWSNSARERLAKRNEKVEKARQAGLESARRRAETRENATDVERPLNGRPTIKGKDSKGNQRKGGGDNAPAGAPPPPEDKVQARITRERKFGEELAPYVGEYEPAMVRAFFDYWREPTKSGIKMRCEMEKTWDLKLRLQKWRSNDDKWGTKTKTSDETTTGDAVADSMEKFFASKAQS